MRNKRELMILAWQVFVVFWAVFMVAAASTAAVATDPTLWVAEYGGSAGVADVAVATAVDSSGNTYVTGYSNSDYTGFDYCTVKYDSSGNRQWIQRYNGPDNCNDKATAIAVDSSGNVYVTGISDQIEVWQHGNGNYCTIKYDTNGNQLWVQRYTGQQNCSSYAAAMAVDSSGCIYVTGYNIDVGTGYAYCTIKYDSNGNQLWIQRYNRLTNVDYCATAMAVDSEGNVYVTGRSGLPDSYCCCTVKYDSQGNQLWAKTCDVEEFDTAVTIALDQSGNIYVMACGEGGYLVVKYDPDGKQIWTRIYHSSVNCSDRAAAMAVDSSGNVYITGCSYRGGNDADYCTIKYDTNGNQLWIQEYNGSANEYDKANAIAVDSFGNAYVTGFSDSSNYVYGGHICTVKYDGDGNQLWAQTCNGPGDGYSHANAIAIDSSGNAHITGCSGFSWQEDYCTIKYDTNGDQLWMRNYGGPGSNIDGPTATAVDSSGNIYVTGYSTGVGTDYDYCTIKYDSNGNELWVQKYNGPANGRDQVAAIVVDSSGNVYITGYSYGVGTKSDYCTVKYDTNGNQLWIQRYNGPANDYDEPAAVSVDSLGNVYVTGSSCTADGTNDYCTIKYDSNGNQLWIQRYNGPANSGDQAVAISVDSSANVYVTGGSVGYRASITACGYDYCTIKYDTNGNQLWIQRYSGQGNANQPSAMVMDSAGNIYVTGQSRRNNGYDSCTIKYDSGGNQLWVRTYNGPCNGDDPVTAISLDSRGNVFITGSNYASDTNRDFYTIKYDNNGNQLWVKRYNGAANADDYPSAMTVDASGNAYVTGLSYKSNTTSDFCTVKYDPNGNQLWVQTYSGLRNGFYNPTAMAQGPSGNVYVTGYGGNGSSNYLTIAYAGADPKGSVVINGGAESTNRPDVSLDLSGTSVGGASIGNTIAFVRFSNDNIHWTDWQTYAPIVPWDLIPGDGVKTVYAQFKDSIGNVSQVCTDSISITNSPVGSLRVVIMPAWAASAGAQWRRVGKADWHNSGDSENLPVGNYSIEFKEVPNWGTPATVAAKVTDNQTTEISAVYTSPTIAEAKSQPDSAPVLTSGVVTAVFGDSFYIESSDRSMGIRVEKADHGMVAGTTVQVAGHIMTDDMGERYIAATDIYNAGATDVLAFILNNKALGGGDYNYNSETGAGQRGVAGGIGLNNIGLLVKITGRVTGVGSGFFYIDDGTHTKNGSLFSGVRIECGSNAEPMEKQYVTVTGVSSIVKVGDGYFRCLRLISSNDESLPDNQ